MVRIGMKTHREHEAIYVTRQEKTRAIHGYMERFYLQCNELKSFVANRVYVRAKHPHIVQCSYCVDSVFIFQAYYYY